jgi:hypothetical protein
LLNNDNQIRITDATGSTADLDLTFVGSRSALLYAWKVGTDLWNSGHFPISIEYNGIIEPRKGSKKAFRPHNKDTDWTAFTKEVKEKIVEVKTHNGWNREREREREM